MAKRKLMSKKRKAELDRFLREPIKDGIRKQPKLTEKEINKRFKGQIEALNIINRSRVLWSFADAVKLVKKTATEKQKKDIIKSIETIVRVWTKTLKEIN